MDVTASGGGCIRRNRGLGWAVEATLHHVPPKLFQHPAEAPVCLVSAVSPRSPLKDEGPGKAAGLGQAKAIS